jgi:hypothetical protein
LWFRSCRRGGDCRAAALSFDFNLLNLRSRESESISTLLDLAHDPDRSPNAMDALTPTRAAAAALAERLRALPEVAKVLTIDDFIPTDQEAKLALIADAALVLDLTLNPLATKLLPTEAEIIENARATAAALRKAAGTATTEAAGVARSLAGGLDTLANADTLTRADMVGRVTSGLPTLLSNVRSLLAAEAVTLERLPPEIARDFIAPSGEVRVRIYPGRPDGQRVALAVRQAVTAVAPHAVGVPLTLEESAHDHGRVAEAGLYSAAIAVLLAITLGVRGVRWRRAVGARGALTLATRVVIGLAELCEHHRVAAVVRHRRRVRHLLCYGGGTARCCNRR